MEKEIFEFSTGKSNSKNFILNTKLKSNELKISRDEYKKLTLMYDNSKNARGQILDKCIDIENSINIIIQYFFTKSSKNEEFYLLKEYILDSEAFTFIQKKKVLEKILEKLDFLDKKKVKKIIQTLMNIIKDRNKLAHGLILIDYEEMKTQVRYYENGYKFERFGKEFYDKFNERFDFLYRELQLIIDYYIKLQAKK